MEETLRIKWCPSAIESRGKLALCNHKFASNMEPTRHRKTVAYMQEINSIINIGMDLAPDV